MPNEKIHEEIESWLAADVHEQLTEEERAVFQQHLADCATCRALQQEEKNMHQLLNQTLAPESADPAFEERMVGRFRDKSPAPSGGLIPFFTGVLRMRAAQITAVAALLLTLVQVGKMVTGEGQSRPQSEPRLNFVAQGLARDEKKSAEVGASVTASNIPAAEEAAPNPTLDIHRDLVAKSVTGLSPAAPAAKSELQPKEKDDEDRSDAAASGQLSNEAAPASLAATSAENRKLIRNAQLELQVANYEATVQRLTTFATEDGGYVATQDSSKLPNGKLQGTIVIKVAPQNLDRFLQKARSLGELKNQTLGTQDVTKAYFDTDARLRNAQRMEKRLLEMLEKKTGKVSDLLEVEKELARVRESIEQMQGELKYYDALVQYATVTISLAEKDLNEPAAFLLRETANLSLFSADVEKTFGAVKSALQNASAQIVQSTLDRDNSGQATARMTLLLDPKESDAVIEKIKSLGRVQNFNLQTERVAQNGSGLSNTAKVERDKVELNLVISRTAEEAAVQQTRLAILTSAVPEKVARLKAETIKLGGELRGSTFARTPDGQELANLILRAPMKSYPALMKTFEALGKVKDVNIQRNDQLGTIADPENAPVEISVQVYTPNLIVPDESGFAATIRRTLSQGVAALTWSVRMIGVALAFLAPWALALGLVGWLVLRFAKRRPNR